VLFVVVVLVLDELLPQRTVVEAAVSAAESVVTFAGDTPASTNELLISITITNTMSVSRPY
jgi:hypothetical protein